MNRLDRSAAIPTVEGLALTQWAEDQACKLRATEELTWTQSARLLALGANPDELLVIRHGKKDWSANRLKVELNGRDEIWLIDERDCSYESDVDSVLKPEFESYLELKDRVFITKRGTAINEFIQNSGSSIHADSEHWPRPLLGDRLCQPYQIFESVVNAAWPDCELVKDQERVIGSVCGVDILRHVDIIYKMPRGDSAT